MGMEPVFTVCRKVCYAVHSYLQKEQTKNQKKLGGQRHSEESELELKYEVQGSV